MHTDITGSTQIRTYAACCMCLLCACVRVISLNRIGNIFYEIIVKHFACSCMPRFQCLRRIKPWHRHLAQNLSTDLCLISARFFFRCPAFYGSSFPVQRSPVAERRQRPVPHNWPSSPTPHPAAAAAAVDLASGFRVIGSCFADDLHYLSVDIRWGFRAENISGKSFCSFYNRDLH